MKNPFRSTAKLLAEIDRLRVQLAAAGLVASSDLNLDPQAYGYSEPLSNVVRLRDEVIRLRKVCDQLRIENAQYLRDELRNFV